MRQRGLGGGPVLRIPDDADDREPLRRLRHFDVLPHRIVVGPDSTRERLVHYDDRRRLQVVAVREIAAAQQRNAHGAEVIRRDHVLAGARFAARRRGAPLDHERRVAPIAAERHAADERHRLHAGHGLHAFDRLLEEPHDVLRLRVLRRRQPELQREDVAGIETETGEDVRRVEADVHMLQRHHALHDQSRHREQRHRQRGFGDDEHVARAAAGPRPAPEAGLQHPADIRPRGAQRRRQPAQDGDDNRNARGEEQHALIERDLGWNRHVRRAQPRQRLQRPASEQQSETGRRGGEQAGFHEHLPRDREAARAERRAQRDFALPIHRAREQEIAHVHARNEQDGSDGGQQEHQAGARIADERLVRQFEVRAAPRLASGIRDLEPLRDHVEVGARRGQRDA